MKIYAFQLSYRLKDLKIDHNSPAVGSFIRVQTCHPNNYLVNVPSDVLVNISDKLHTGSNCSISPLSTCSPFAGKMKAVETDIKQVSIVA